MVADSRQVALNHTAGLSLPQQVQMTLFAASALIDRDDSYKLATRAIIGRRLTRLYEGMGIALGADPLRAGYYAEIDLQIWARQRYGTDFADWLGANYEPVDPLFRLRATVHRPAAGCRLRRTGVERARVARQPRRRRVLHDRPTARGHLRRVRRGVAPRQPPAADVR